MSDSQSGTPPPLIPVYSNSLGEQELRAVARVFESRWLGMGKECQELERQLGAMWGTSNVLLLNNCTAGLFISLRALGVGPGDEVIISTANFLGCANAVIDCGAKPVFADVDPRFLAISPEEIDRLRTPRTKAVFILHYGGHPCNFDAVRAACGDRITIIEDSANAPASTYKGRACGTLGEAGTFSFDAMKILVMGDGGALILRDSEAYARAKSLRYLGFRDKSTSGVDSMKQGAARWWEFDIDCPSGRFISNDILAAVGQVQLAKLPDFISRRKQVWEIYQREFSAIPGLVTPPDPLEQTTSSYYIYWVRAAGHRDALARYLLDHGVYSTFRYFPLHLVPFYGASAHLPVAEAASEEILNLPLHQNLTDNDVDRVVETVKGYFRDHG